MARVRVAGAALRDLEDLLDYLRSYSPAGARRVELAIVGKIDLLAPFPEIGRLLESREGVDYRQTVAAGYLS